MNKLIWLPLVFALGVRLPIRRAVTFYSDLLTDNDPNPPPIPLKQIRRSSSNKKWTVINFVAVRMTFGLCYPFCIFPFDGGRNGVI